MSRFYGFRRNDQMREEIADIKMANEIIIAGVKVISIML